MNDSGKLTPQEQKKYLQNLMKSVRAFADEDVLKGKRTKDQSTEERVSTLEGRVESLERKAEDLKDEVKEEQLTLKRELASFTFEAVSIIVGVIAVILTVSIGLSLQNVADEAERLGYIAGLMTTIALLLAVWLILWFYNTFYRNRSSRKTK